MPFCSIEGRRCFYRDAGKGMPILFGHSYLWSSEMWEPQIECLSKEFRCIAPDLWDHGKSDSLGEASYSVERVADDMWKLMEFLEIREFLVVGLSVGGMWGGFLALKHPEAVRSLVLMDTFVGDEPLGTQRKYFALLDMLAKEKRFTKPLLDQVVPLFFSPHTLSFQKHLADGFRDSLASIREENIPGIVSMGRAIFSRTCLLDKLPNLSQPTLVLVGQDDIPRPPKESEEMARRLPNGQMKAIEKAGHISNLEQPEIVNSLLLNFLDPFKAGQAMAVYDDVF